jgi:hypothetical protein
MSVRLNLEAFGTYKTTTNERKGTLYSTRRLSALVCSTLVLTAAAQPWSQISDPVRSAWMDKNKKEDYS